MTALTRSELSSLRDSGSFWWSTGIEDTFITAPWPGSRRTLDEYELIRHYRHWREDLELMASLGVGVARYGVPWYRVNPAPGKWQWRWADDPLERLLELGIQPIVDLVHYGVPAWLEGAFAAPDFAERLAEYATRLAERYRGRIHAFTPLNEPRITAWYTGRLGWWPPHRRGWRGFAEVLMSICRAVALTSRAVRAVDPGNFIVHADGADVYHAAHPSKEAEAEHRQRLVFLPLDLLFGRVDRSHPLRPWLLEVGIGEQEIERFGDLVEPPDIIGLNIYPMFSNKLFVGPKGGVRLRNRVRFDSLVEEAADLHWPRFPRPLMIAETAARGTPARREQWLGRSLADVRRLRGRGVPVIGYAWWPMISHVAWAYRQGRKEIGDYVEPMGLWDLDVAGGFRRTPTALVDTYRALVEGGDAAVGPLACAG
jgi:beta-glucosidase/6-phospho-beta-glucosidase/beta-galactosidase